MAIKNIRLSKHFEKCRQLLVVELKITTYRLGGLPLWFCS